MKYLKICSFAVLSLLLFAPAAMADIECRLQPNLDSIRAESKMEKIEDVEMRCEWGANDLLPGTVRAGNTAYVAGSTFDLVVRLSARPIDDDKMKVMLKMGGDDPRTVADESVAVAPATTAGWTEAGEISGPNIRWDDVPFPIHDGSTNDSGWDQANADSGTFMITGIYVDATGGSGSVTATADMAADGLSTDTNPTLNVPSERVTIAGIDQAMTLELSSDVKVMKVNSCVATKFNIDVDLGEGFRTAWTDIDHIRFMVSSGTITGPATAGVLTRDSASGDMVTYRVDPTNLRDSQDNVTLTIDPEPGNEGDDITVSVMFVPTHQSKAKFVTSATITVGMYVACEGDTLLFPFITSRSGFDTGIAITNTSKLDGNCGLMWDGAEATDLKKVSSMDQITFTLSNENPDFQGYLMLKCEFSGAHAYAWIVDTIHGSGAQGYLARRSPDYN